MLKVFLGQVSLALCLALAAPAEAATIGQDPLIRQAAWAPVVDNQQLSAIETMHPLCQMTFVACVEGAEQQVDAPSKGYEMLRAFKGDVFGPDAGQDITNAPDLAQLCQLDDASCPDN